MVILISRARCFCLLIYLFLINKVINSEIEVIEAETVTT